MVLARVSFLSLLISGLLGACLAGSGPAVAQAQPQIQAPAPARTAPAAPSADKGAAQPAPATGPGAAEPGASAAPAAEAPPPAPPPPVLSPVDQQALKDLRDPVESSKNTIEAFAKIIERNAENDEELAHLRGALLEAIAKARALREALRPKAEAIHQQVAQLGPAPAKDAAPESDQVAGERARLNAMAAEIDGALKTADLAVVRGRQLYGELQAARQTLFAKNLLMRGPSPLLPTTWTLLAEDIPAASRQITDSLGDWFARARGKGTELAGLAAVALLVFLALTFIVRRFLAWRLDRARKEPPGFFLQAATAGWVAPLLAVPAMAALATAAIELDWLELLTNEVGQIAEVAFPALAVFVAVSALTRAILSPRRIDWRLVDLSTPAARHVTRIITQIAAVFAIDLILQETIRRLYLPLSVSVVETAAASIAIALLMLALVRTPFDPKPIPSGKGPGEGAIASLPTLPTPRLRPYLLKLPLMAVALTILVLALSGYIGLGRFISTQIVVTGSAIALVLLFHLAIRAMLGAPGSGIKPFATVLKERAGLDSRQAAVLTRALSVLLNTTLALIALPLILLTWGYSLAEAMAWMRSLVFGFQIGDVRVSLIRIILAALLFLGLILVTRLTQRWLDLGMRKSHRVDHGIANSIHTMIGYTGFIVAALAAVSYGGLDITSFAIVAGALSVGIGFGLQSIINNFVSGLILLIERPIKVGDRVTVNGQDGFVRRISVRSTEIETFDRASLIVPNSEFITTTVTNWTHRNVLGRALVKVRVSYQSDPEQVRDILQKVAADSQLILQYPAPWVGLEDFGPHGLEFTLIAVVPDVGSTGTVSSDLRFRIFKAFKAAGIEIPHAQHDIHLRDLDAVRGILTRLAEERARKADAGVLDPKKDGAKS